MTASAPVTREHPGFGTKAAVWLAFALLVVIVFGAAFIRFAQGDATLDGPAEVARWVYRVAAIAFVLVTAGVAVLGWEMLGPGAHAVLAAQIVLAVALTFLGRVTPSSDHPLVAFGNPLGGLALVGLGWWLVLAVSRRSVRRSMPLAGVVLAVIAFGAIAAVVLWRPGLGAGLAAQLAATVALVAGVTLAYPRNA